MAGDIVEHGGFRIAILREGEKYIAWIACPQRRELLVGYSMGQQVSTRHFDAPEGALASAKQIIDSGEVQKLNG
jgi:hypothetical protein